MCSKGPRTKIKRGLDNQIRNSSCRVVSNCHDCALNSLYTPEYPHSSKPRNICPSPGKKFVFCQYPSQGGKVACVIDNSELMSLLRCSDGQIYAPSPVVPR